MDRRGTDEVIGQILREISDGKLRAGDRISEAKLCELFDINRYTCRAVLNKLNILGVAETVHGKGTYIKKPSSSVLLASLIPLASVNPNDFIAVSELRAGFEPEAARLAAMRANDEQIRELEQVLNHMKQNNNNLKIYAKDDIQFHYIVACATQNEMYVQMMRVVQCMFKMHILKITDLTSLADHSDIFEAILHRDPDKAYYSMKRHMEIVYRNALKEKMAGSSGQRSQDEKTTAETAPVEIETE